MQRLISRSALHGFGAATYLPCVIPLMMNGVLANRTPVVGDRVRLAKHAANKDVREMLGIGTVERLTRTRYVVEWDGLKRRDSFNESLVIRGGVRRIYRRRTRSHSQRNLEIVAKRAGRNR